MLDIMTAFKASSAANYNPIEKAALTISNEKRVNRGAAKGKWGNGFVAFLFCPSGVLVVYVAPSCYHCLFGIYK